MDETAMFALAGEALRFRSSVVNIIDTSCGIRLFAIQISETVKLGKKNKIGVPDVQRMWINLKQGVSTYTQCAYEP